MISIRKLVLNFLMLAIAICFPGSSCASDMLSVADLTAAYNKLDLSINNGDGFSLLNNDQGGLAWGESYILMSYLDMFEATKNVVYLDKFFRHANRIIANTDKDRKIVDYKAIVFAACAIAAFPFNESSAAGTIHNMYIRNTEK